LLVKWRIYRTLCWRLAETVQQIDPDVLIGLGYFQANVVTGIRCRAMKVVESHEARIFTMGDQGLNRSWLSRLYMRYYKQRYFRTIERQADVVVTLTEGDAREWQRARRVEVIPNFSVMSTAPSSLSHSASHRVIAVGRLEWQKGFDRLIDAWAMIGAEHPQWRLDIFGSGTMEEALNARIAAMESANNSESGRQIAIHPFTNNIASEYATSSIFALSSRFEGFGLVLLEAMQHGLPCVVFDCPFGPSDVVANGECGFVVPDGDITAFARQLARLMDDEPLRQRFAAAARERAKRFSVEKVMEQWRDLFLKGTQP
jgi:glycosyltransferase involved in cell wall biosynthesis